MINDTTTLHRHYRTLANATTYATNAVAAAIKGCKRGFLFCLVKVHNSLISFNKVITSGFHCLRQKLRLSQTTAEATERFSVPTKIEILPISAELTKEVCQAIRQHMETDPSCLNEMFRVKPTETNAELNELIRHPKELLAKIADKRLSGVVLGYLVKQWIALTLKENKFTPAERKLLIDNKSDSQMIDKIIDDKFPDNDPDNRAIKEKFISLLSVMSKYNDLCAANLDIENRHYDSGVMEINCVHPLFAIDWSIDNFQKELTEAKIALSALLKHASTAVPPEPEVTD